MSRTFFAATSVAALFLAPCAMAQDAFTGAYAGLGLSFSRTESAVDGVSGHRRDARAATLDVYGGWLTQTQGGFVWGPELALSGLPETGETSGGGIGTTRQDGGILLSTRVRGGFVAQNTFFYGSLGLGLTNAIVEDTASTDHDWAIGTSFGLGAETALNDTWNVRLDAQRFNLGLSDRSFGGQTKDTHLDHTKISLGLTRRF